MANPSERKFTKGPWTWTKYRAGGNCERSLDGVGSEGVIFHAAAWKPKEANCRLISAAPDLAEALQALYPHIHEDGMENGEMTEFKIAWLKAEAALKKAGL